MNNTQDLVGKTKEEALKILEEAGMTARILKEDAQEAMGTCDYDTNRVTLDIAKGIVVKVQVG